MVEWDFDSILFQKGRVRVVLYLPREVATVLGN